MSAQLERRKQVVRDFLKATGVGDGEAMGRLLHPDVEVIVPGRSIMSGNRTYDDMIRMAAMLPAMTKDGAGVDFQISRLTAEEDRVAAEFHGESTLTDGTPYNNDYFFHFVIPEDRIVWMSEYFCTKHADEVFRPLVGGE